MYSLRKRPPPITRHDAWLVGHFPREKRNVPTDRERGEAAVFAGYEIQSETTAKGFMDKNFT